MCLPYFIPISEGDINKNENPRVWKTWDDGYSVRAMVPSDAAIVQEWYIQIIFIRVKLSTKIYGFCDNGT